MFRIQKVYKGIEWMSISYLYFSSTKSQIIFPDTVPEILE